MISQIVTTYFFLHFLTVSETLENVENPSKLVVQCPDLCVCDTWYGLERATCAGRHLYDIDAGVPNEIQALDLSNNSISYLNNFELANIGLVNLKYLNLSKNAISQIGLEAFTHLNDLIVLDLSRNHLYYLLSDIFSQHSNLRILKLSKNNFGLNVPRLRCPGLTDLSMDRCQISHIPLGTFNELKHLRSLDLSNNVMIQLHSHILHPLKSLKKITLTGNFFSCNKVTYDMQLYLRRKNVDFESVCATPVLSPRKFEKMILLEDKPIIQHKKIVEEKLKRNISQSVIPKLQVFTFSNVTQIRSPQGPALMDTIRRISSYWLFIFGFILGTISTIIFGYCCLLVHSIRFNRRNQWIQRPRRRRRERNDAQTMHLLHHFWHTEESTDPVSRPDTPPPTYREVMSKFTGLNHTITLNPNRNNRNHLGTYI